MAGWWEKRFIAVSSKMAKCCRVFEFSRVDRNGRNTSMATSIELRFDMNETEKKKQISLIDSEFIYLDESSLSNTKHDN